MKVLILCCCLAGVWLLAAPAYARTVPKDATLHRQHTQFNLNNNNNKRNNNNKHIRLHSIEASVATLKSEVNAAHILETALEPPHTTKRAIRLAEKRPQRPNSKFLRWPEDANVVQHTANNDELELVENTTESPKRKLTTTATSSKNNRYNNNENKKNSSKAVTVDRNRLSAKLRKHKKQEVGNETPAEVEQQSGAEVSTPIVGGAKQSARKQRKQKQKGAQKQGKKEAGNLRNKKVLNKNENHIEKVNAKIKNNKHSTSKTANKVNAAKKPSSKPKQQPLLAQNKQRKPVATANKVNRKVNTGNSNTFSKRTPKKTQSLSRPPNRRTRRRNRFSAPFYKYFKRAPKNAQSFRGLSNGRRRRRNRMRAPSFRRRHNRWRN